jgi:hypothetical protein
LGRRFYALTTAPEPLLSLGSGDLKKIIKIEE